MSCKSCPLCGKPKSCHEPLCFECELKNMDLADKKDK
jgi:hypothetical protein